MGCCCGVCGGYKRTLLVSFSSGLTIPTGFCIDISTDGGSTWAGSTQYTSMPVSGSSWCVPLIAPNSDCIYDYEDTTTGTFTTQASGPTCFGTDHGVVVQVITPGVLGTSQVNGLLHGGPSQWFTASGFTVPKSGSVTVSNTMLWRPHGGGASTAFGGTATITDVSC